MKILSGRDRDVRVRREVSTAQQREHGEVGPPNIVAVYDFGQDKRLRGDDDSRIAVLLFAREYVGRRQIFRQRISPPKKHDAREANGLVPQSATPAIRIRRGVAIVIFKHEQHPAVTAAVGVKTRRLRMEKRLGRRTDPKALTAHSIRLMGTLRYRPPEQMEGTHEVDHRAYIYSLGVVFYELLKRRTTAGSFAPPSKKVQIDVR